MMQSYLRLVWCKILHRLKKCLARLLFMMNNTLWQTFYWYVYVQISLLILQNFFLAICSENTCIGYSVSYLSLFSDNLIDFRQFQNDFFQFALYLLHYPFYRLFQPWTNKMIGRHIHVTSVSSWEFGKRHHFTVTLSNEQNRSAWHHNILCTRVSAKSIL